MLLTPGGNYVNFYSLCLNANAEGILDFWKHVSMLMNEFGADQFDLASGAGSEAARTVFHFHLRFEFYDRAIRNCAGEKKEMTNRTKVLAIGAGPAGYTAAI